jgi:16S rRNA G966 N2-methylase RsmD
VFFYDPPYATDYEELLNFLGEHAARLLAEDGVVIVEHHKKKDLQEEFGGLQRYRVLEQGDSRLSFYQARSRIAAKYL